MDTPTIKYPNIRVKLVGEDGNAYAIMGRVTSAMKQAGIPAEEREAYMKEAMASDYSHVLRTTMEWVNCSDWYAEPTRRYTNSRLEQYWDDVKYACHDAVLIAWDTCHKIYLAMDEEQAQWFRENYSEACFTGTPEEMLKTLQEWYDESCGLKFIQAVSTTDDPNDGYESLIPQGAEDEEVCQSCGDSMKQPYADGVCEMCWESDEEDEEGEDW